MIKVLIRKDRPNYNKYFLNVNVQIFKSYIKDSFSYMSLNVLHYIWRTVHVLHIQPKFFPVTFILSLFSVVSGREQCLLSRREQCLLIYHSVLGSSLMIQVAVESRWKMQNLTWDISDSTGAVKCKDVCTLNFFTATFFVITLSLNFLKYLNLFLSSHYMELFVIVKKWIKRDFPAQLRYSSCAWAVFPTYSGSERTLKGWGIL